MNPAAVLFLAAILAGPATSADTFEAGAYMKSSFFFFRLPAGSPFIESTDPSGMAALSTRFRLTLSLHPSSAWSVQFAYDLVPRLQDRRLFEDEASGFRLSLPDYRIADLRARLIPPAGRAPGNFGLFQNLDRFALTLRAGAADFIIGRQAVSWGSARIVNPTDILSPFAFDETDKEERRGVDAIRVRLALGDMDELDCGVVAGRDFSAGTSAAFIRARTNVWKTDVSFLALAFRRRFLLGLDLARSLGGAGAWLEAAYVFADASRKTGGLSGEEYFRASLGLDLNLSPKVYAFAEVHVNTAGAGDPADYASLFDTVAFRDGAVYLLGRTYLGAGATVQVHPLVSTTGTVLVNVNDGSIILAPMFEASVTENIDLAAGLFLGAGRSPFRAEDSSAGSGALLRSEFGAYPDMVYASFRAYF